MDAGKRGETEMKWIANLLLLCGVWRIGKRKRSGFLFGFCGELMWLREAFNAADAAMLMICLAFAVMYLVDWFRWGKDKQ
jgi:nicotinamide riboside transporter PnuC